MPTIGETISGQLIGHGKNHKYVWHKCPSCGCERWASSPSVQRNPQLICGSCNSRLSSKIAVGVTRKERCNLTDGYVAIRIEADDKYIPMVFNCKPYVLEHRLVMARSLGRCLTKTEQVHHKNGNRSDNRIENLELTTASGHHKDHCKGYEHGFNKGYADGLKAAKLEVT
jgi:hypothetical protein